MHILLSKLFGISKIVEVYALIVNVEQQNVDFWMWIWAGIAVFHKLKQNAGLEGQSPFSFG